MFLAVVIIIDVDSSCCLSIPFFFLPVFTASDKLDLPQFSGPVAHFISKRVTGPKVTLVLDHSNPQLACKKHLKRANPEQEHLGWLLNS